MGRLSKGKEVFDMPAVRVLLVDGDKKYQLELARMLHECGYVVSKCNRGKNALARLRKDRSRFDIMMTERKLPDMDGFKLLQKVVQEMNLPVIVISIDNDSEAKKNILIHGAYYYLVKPISMDILEMVWQNLFRENISKPAELQQPTNDVSKTKKKRVDWTPELHKKFTESVAELKKEGFEKPTPKMILNRMEAKGVKCLTVENVKSHKQKWKKKLQDMQGYNGPSPVRVESMNLATQLRQAPAAMNRDSHHIGAPDCPSLQFPFVASSGAIEDTCGYQSNNVMTQIMTQTPSSGKICNELLGGPAFDNRTYINASKNFHDQNLDKIEPFPFDNDAIYRTPELFNKFDSGSWDCSNSGYNNFKNSDNTFLPSFSGNITNSVENPWTSQIDKDTLPDTSLEGTCGNQSNNFMTQIMTQIPSNGQIYNERPGGQAFDYDTSDDALTNLLAINRQNHRPSAELSNFDSLLWGISGYQNFLPSFSGNFANSVGNPLTSLIDKDTLPDTLLEGNCGYRSNNFMTQIPSSGQICNEFTNDPDNCPSPELFGSLLWGNSEDHDFTMSNNTFRPSSSRDCVLFDIADIPFASMIVDEIPRNIDFSESDDFS